MATEGMFCFAVYAMQMAIGRLYQKPLGEMGLTYPQYLAMVTLWEKGPMRVGDLGAAVGLESNTLTPMLKRLERLGLVTRTRSSQDERQVIVGLTGAGDALRAKAHLIPECLLAAAGLPPEDLRRLTDTLNALRGRIETQAGPG